VIANLCLQLLAEPTPTSSYLIDDAGTINKTTKKAVNDRLKRLEYETGYRVEAVTVRKLEVEADAFAFTDRLLESWCDCRALNLVFPLKRTALTSFT
jgi:uncharacterized membrane protein YgcG